jgi:serine protease inhibitor
MMEIRNFDRVRLGGKDNFIDVRSVEHSDCGLMISAYEFKNSEGEKRVIEVRKKNREIALFVLLHNELNIDEYWKDAEVLYRYEAE